MEKILSEIPRNRIEREREREEYRVRFANGMSVTSSVSDKTGISFHFNKTVHGIREHQVARETAAIFAFAVIIIYSRGIDVMS